MKKNYLIFSLCGLVVLSVIAFLFTNKKNNSMKPAVSALSRSNSDSDSFVTAEEFYDANQTKVDSVLERYADIAFENYRVVNVGVLGLKTAIEDFVKKPSSINLITAKNAWIKSRAPYLLVEALRFAGNPIDDEDFKCDDEECEGLINAWPLEETTIDTFITNSADDVNGKITFEKILGQNGKKGVDDDAKETDVKVGWHAIEYLLWGKDENNNDAGSRSATDFEALQANFTAADNTQKKARSKYLYEVTLGLEKYLKKLQDAWDKTDTNSWRNTKFNNNKENKIKHLKRIYKGFGTLITGEIGSERIKPDASQEDEHSCFSDNTKADFYYDLQGILNLWEGEYKLGSTTINQPSVTEGIDSAKDGLKTLIELKNKPLAKKIVDTIKQERDKFCLNIYNSDPNYKVDASCPVGSIKSRYDQILGKGKTGTDKNTLENIQKVLIIDLKSDMTKAGNEIGVTFGPNDFVVQ